jgi:hypothetical protein
MLTQKNLFAKALLVEKPWFVHEIKFDQNEGEKPFIFYADQSLYNHLHITTFLVIVCLSVLIWII